MPSQQMRVARERGAATLRSRKWRSAHRPQAGTPLPRLPTQRIKTVSPQPTEMTRRARDLRGAHLAQDLVRFGGCGRIFGVIAAGEVQVAERLAAVGVALLRVNFADS